MQQQNRQKPGLDIILKQAFYYWKSTLIFQLVFSLIYFSIFFFVIYYTNLKYGIFDQYLAIYQENASNITQFQVELQKLSQSPEYESFYWYIIGTAVFLYPLNIGLFNIFRKKDLKEPIALGDLFAGYRGMNFFKFASFYLFWIMTSSLLGFTIILPFVWIFITIFSAPIMFFMNKSIFESISINFKAIKLFFIEILVGVFIAFFFRYSGLILFFFGILFTYPFANAMIYALYRNIFVESKDNQNQ